MPGFAASGAAITDANYRVALFTLDNTRQPVGAAGDGLARLRWTTRQVQAEGREAVRSEVLVGRTDAPAIAGQAMRADHLLGGDPLWLDVVSALPDRTTGTAQVTAAIRPGTPPGG